MRLVCRKTKLQPHQPAKHAREQSIEENKKGHGGWFDDGSAFRPDIFGIISPAASSERVGFNKVATLGMRASLIGLVVK